MEKALRRRCGVDVFIVDTDEQWATVRYLTPHSLDFPGLTEAADSASFPLISIELSVAGQVSQQHCDTCAAEVPVFVLEGSEQAIELPPDALPDGFEGMVRGMVEGFKGPHPVFVPLEPETSE